MIHLIFFVFSVYGILFKNSKPLHLGVVLMRRIFTVLLSLSMLVLMCACGLSPSSGEDGKTSVVSTDQGYVKAAVISAFGDISDQGYNQTVYEVCRDFCDDNHIDFAFYKSEENSTEAHLSAIAAAVSEGCNLLIIPGSSFARAVTEACELYPDVKFVALDVSAEDLLLTTLGDKYDGNPDSWTVTDFYHWENVTCGDFQEELAGFLAGYAAVKMGFARLGFLGTDSESSRRYGSGFVQGADLAVGDSGAEVSIQYALSNDIAGNDDLTAAVSEWYENGTEIVMVSDGSVYTSVAEAARKHDGNVIGANCDQASTIDKKYGNGLTITSAAKNIAGYLENVLSAVVEGRWEDLAGRTDVMGLVSEKEPARNGVYLPSKTTMWNDSFSEEDYDDLLSAVIDGDFSISFDHSQAEPTANHVSLNVVRLDGNAEE